MGSSFSFGEETLSPLTGTGARFEEFSIVATYDIQNRVMYGYG